MVPGGAAAVHLEPFGINKPGLIGKYLGRVGRGCEVVYKSLAENAGVFKDTGHCGILFLFNPALRNYYSHREFVIHQLGPVVTANITDTGGRHRGSRQPRTR